MNENYEQLEQRINKLSINLLKLEVMVLGLAKIQKDIVIKQEQINKEIVSVLILIKKQLRIK